MITWPVIDPSMTNGEAHDHAVLLHVGEAFAIALADFFGQQAGLSCRPGC